MREYLFTARRDGTRVTERVEADDANDALRRLRGLGYEDVTLHTDDICAVVGAPPAAETGLTDDEYVAVRTASKPAMFFFKLGRWYLAGWFVFLPAFALVVGRWLVGLPFAAVDGVLVTILTVPAVLVGWEVWFGVAAGHWSVNEALSWGRWADALRQLPAIKGRVQDFEFYRCKAKALAGLGRTDAALKAMRKIAADPAVPEWMYRSLLAETLDRAGRHGEAAAEYERAAELAPENATVQLDRAMYALRRRRDVTLARAALAEAERHATTDVTRPFLAVAQGMLAVEENRPEDARRLLGEALAAVKKFVHAAPQIGSFQALIHGYLCLAEAAAGNREAARRHLKRAEPRATALGEAAFVARCREAVGEAPAGGAA